MPPTKKQNAPVAGAKLDAGKRVEYLADVSSQWDSSSWPRWMVTGRVLPERCNVTVAPVTSRGVGALGRFELRLEVAQSHVAATLLVEKPDASHFEIADIIRTALAFPVNYIAFMNRGAYETVLDLCVRADTGEAFTLPIFEPTFDQEDPGLCFKTGSVSFSIPYKAHNYQLGIALNDLTQAVRFPPRTFEYCRMAMEVVRNHFDPADTKGHRDRHIEGEKRMCDALVLERASLQALDAVAARSRHGDLVFSINWELRRRALEFAWEVVARFMHHLEHGGAAEVWKRLDEKFENYRSTSEEGTIGSPD